MIEPIHRRVVDSLGQITFTDKKKAEDKSQSAGNAKNVIMMIYYGIDVFQDKRIIRVLILKLKGVNS